MSIGISFGQMTHIQLLKLRIKYRTLAVQQTNVGRGWMTIFKLVYYAVVNLVQLRNCTTKNICALKEKKKKKQQRSYLSTKTKVCLTHLSHSFTML